MASSDARTPATNPTASAQPEPQSTIVIPVIDERVEVDKCTVETGRVRVHTIVQTHEQLVDEPLIEEHAHIERVPVQRYVDGPVPVRTEGDTIVISVVEEVLVVEKRLMLKEEVRITRKRVETHAPQSVAVRQQRVQIERIEPDSESPAQAAKP